MSDEQRRVNDTPWGDTARILAILYIIGFLGMVGALFLMPIPPGNKELVLTLAGIMSTVQAAIIGWYFGGSRTGETAQRTLAASKEKSDATLQELAKAPVQAAVLAAAKDPAPPLDSATLKTDDVKIDATGGNVTIEGKP